MLWGSRCLMSLAVALYILPPLFSAAVAAIMPLLVIMNDAAMTGLRSMVIVVGAMALVLVVNTSWSRRILAVVLFAIGGGGFCCSRSSGPPSSLWSSS